MPLLHKQTSKQETQYHTLLVAGKGAAAVISHSTSSMLCSLVQPAIWSQYRDILGDMFTHPILLCLGVLMHKRAKPSWHRSSAVLLCLIQVLLQLHRSR